MSPRRLALALLAATVAGCASGGANARDMGEDCAGLSVLTVMNSSGQDVMIVEHHRSSNASHAITTVGPGTHEITVRSEADYRYRALSANTASIEAQREVTRGNTVRLQRECRAPGRSGV